MTFLTCLIVMLGGAFGTLARYMVSIWTAPISRELPWGTIIINITGSCLIGFFGTMTLASGRFPVSDNLRLFVMVGFCGGYTTFSSFSLQSLDLLRSGAFVRAGINMVASVILCILAVALGHYIAAHYNGDRVAIAQTQLEEEG